MNGKSNIPSIGEEGLIYVTESGEERFIDFQRCYENYVVWQTQTDHLEEVRNLNQMDDEQLKEYVAGVYDWKEVAYRGIDGFPWSTEPCLGPCLEFHTEPPDRIEFDNAAEFEKLCRARQAGWQTTDLS